jgi:hypothetical protein
MTIAQQLNITKFPFEIKDEKGRLIYAENKRGYWAKMEYDEDGNQIYREDSDGDWSKWIMTKMERKSITKIAMEKS